MSLSRYYRNALNGHKLLGLTGLRGIAAIWVFAFHLQPLATISRIGFNIQGYFIDLSPFVTCGWIGVNVFFVLSGFLLSLPYIEWTMGKKNKPSTFKFFMKRILRIVPSYYFQIVVLFLSWAYGNYFLIDTAKVVISHLFLVQNFFLSGGHELINGVYWTLPIEFNFYILLPALFIFLKKVGEKAYIFTSAFIFFLLTAMFYRYFIVESMPFQVENIPQMAWLMEQLPGTIDQFFCGIYAAFFYCYLKDNRAVINNKNYLGNTLITIGLVAMILIIYQIHWHVIEYWSGSWLLILGNSILGVAISLIVFGVALDSSFARIVSNPFMVLLGIISYGIYLWHLPIITIVQQNLNFIINATGLKLVSIFFLIPMCVFIIAGLNYICIEKHFLSTSKQNTTIDQEKDWKNAV